MLLAKSLVVFIAVGVVSGFLFGVYLYDLKNPNELVFSDGPSLSILTDKTVYKQGDTVQIRIVNTGTVPLVFSDSSFGFKITGLAGFVIYGASDSNSSNNNNNNNIIFDTIPNSDTIDTNTQSNPDMGNDEDTLQTLEPGQQVTFTWDLLKTDRTPVLAGVYKLHTFTADSTPITASITVTVV